jgi:hypothetical protein
MCTVMEDWQSVSLLVVLTAALQLQSNFQMLVYSICTQVTVNAHVMLHVQYSRVPMPRLLYDNKSSTDVYSLHCPIYIYFGP